MNFISSEIKDDMSTEDDYQDSESHTDMDLIQPRGKDGKTMADRKEQEDEIAGAEIRRALTFSRVLLLTVLALSTVGVAAGVYIYTSRAETEAFENQFEEDALKVLESIGTSLDFTLGAVDSFVINEVSHAKSLNMTWPFVTIPDFAVEASKLRSLTKAVVVSQYPYVLESERYAWENYSVTNEAWVEDGLKTQKEDTNFHGTNVEEWKAWG